MKRLTAAIGCIAVCAMMLCANTIKIRVVNYPPQYYQNSEKVWTGLDVELARAVVEDAGYTPEFVDLPWNRALVSIKAGEIDIMCNLSKTEERSEFLQWIGPERYTQMVLIVRKGDKGLTINSLDQMVIASQKTGKKIAIQQNAYYGEDMKKRLETDNDFAKVFVPIPEATQFLAMLQKSRILGYIEERSNIVYKIAHDEQYKDFFVHPFIIHKDPVYFGVSKMVPPEVYNNLVRSYKKLEGNGKLEKIRKKW